MTDTLNITRRDFFNGVLLGAGAMLLGLPTPGTLFAQRSETGWFGGIGDYAASPGNTAEVLAGFGEIRGGAGASAARDAVARSEDYDLVVVGGGLSGLGAAYEFTKSAPREARCLILENHPIFGGLAKRNEFMVAGERLIGPQGSNSFGVIDSPDIRGYEIYQELGLPKDFDYVRLDPSLDKLDFDTTNFGYRLWFDSKSIGHYFGGQGKGKWVAGFWEDGLGQTPYSEKVCQDFLRWRDTTDRNYTGQDYERWLDSMTYQHFLEKVLGLDGEVTRFAHPVLASVVGLGCDAINAYTARQVRMPGFPEFLGHRSLKNSHWHSFPGGNDGISRYLVKSLIPDAIAGDRNFADILNGKVHFPALDRDGNSVRLRLGASVLRVDQKNSAEAGGGISIVYRHQGGLHRVRTRGAVIATGSRLARRIVADLPASHVEAYSRFPVSPILVANVALTNWRFLYRLGFSACKWFDGFGFGCNIRAPMVVGDYRPPLHPDKPAILTFYVSFHEPGLPAEEQGERGRKKLLGTSYREYEVLLLGQMGRLFADTGFMADKDVAGIVLNRWTYAYVNPQPGFYFGQNGNPAPRDIIRGPFGRIAFAHAELNGHQHWVAAVEEGRRAARQALKLG